MLKKLSLRPRDRVRGCGASLTLLRELAFVQEAGGPLTAPWKGRSTLTILYRTEFSALRFVLASLYRVVDYKTLRILYYRILPTIYGRLAWCVPVQPLIKALEGALYHQILVCQYWLPDQFLPRRLWCCRRSYRYVTTIGIRNARAALRKENPWLASTSLK